MHKSFIYHIILLLVLVGCSQVQKEETVKNDSTEITNTSEVSEITCPHRGHKKMEPLPTEACLIRYTCDNCKEEQMSK